jgi:hypothetical protein
MRRGKHISKQLNSTTTIASTPNNGIHCIHFSLRTTSSRLHHLASQHQPGLINISDVDWTTSKSIHSNQQMPYISSSQNSILGFAMIVGLKMTHISSDYYTTGIFPNVSSSCWHISHCRSTSIMHHSRLPTLRGVESTAK